MARLFVSYARTDLEIVEGLVEDLRELGHEPFYDRDLVGGDQWWNVLLDKIEAADGFLPVISLGYRSSEACKAESEWAQALGKPFLPIDLGEVGAELCEPAVAEANWVSYDRTARTTIARLSRAVAQLAPVRPPAIPPIRPQIPVSYLTEIEREIRGAADLPRQRQLMIMSDLLGKFDTREQASAVQLLTELRRRPDLTYEVATAIDAALQRSAYIPQPPRPGPPPYPPPVVDPPPPVRRGSLKTKAILVAVVLVLLGVGAGILILHKRNPSPAGLSTSLPDSPGPSLPTEPPATAITAQVEDQLSSPETDEDVVVTLEGQRVAELHPTSSAPTDIKTIQLTQAGNYSYRLDARTTYVDSNGAMQQTSLTGEGSIAITNNSTWQVIIHSDGSISLDSM